MKTARLRRAFLLLVLSGACLFTTGIGTSLALFTATSASGGNSFATSYWVYYLHNNPTPPAGNTTAQEPLTATTTASTQATFYNYDTGCDTLTGRLLRRGTPSAGLATACYYVYWRLPAQAAALTLRGTLTADVWSATSTGTANRTGSLIAYLRDYNPTAGTYVEIANATYAGSYAVGRTFYERPITIALPGTGTYALPVGHQLELKLESPTATSQNNMMVAYDTTGYPSYLRLR